MTKTEKLKLKENIFNFFVKGWVILSIIIIGLSIGVIVGITTNDYLMH